MNKDARVDVGFPDHPKTMALETALGADGPWCMIKLWLWAAKYRVDGDLGGMSVENIENAVRWRGERGKFVSAALAAGYLDAESAGYVLHDWHQHNVYATTAHDRTERARWAGLVKQYGEEKATNILKLEGKRRQRMAQRPASPTLIAPSPSPSPSPKDREDGLRRAHGTRLPDDWQLTDHLEAEARKILNGNRIDMKLEADRFRDYWHAQPGQRGRKADWTATWRNWIRKASPTGTPHGPAPHRKLSLAEDTEQRIKRFAENQNEPH